MTRYPPIKIARLLRRSGLSDQDNDLAIPVNLNPRDFGSGRRDGLDRRRHVALFKCTPSARHWKTLNKMTYNNG
jgi:hypothetical protein